MTEINNNVISNDGQGDVVADLVVDKPIEEDVNIYFWALMRQISLDNTLLSKEGMLLKRIVLGNGSILSITQVAKYLNVHNGKAGEICRKLESTGYIITTIKGNRKKLTFNEKILQEGLKAIGEILGK